MFSLHIGTSKLDMFTDENIELTQQIGSVSDITKNLGDLTRTFSVPASENNNTLFKHYYNANINNTFDARTKVAGDIKLNGLPFSYGKYRLEKVIVKQGKPSSYSLQYWGNFINIKDKIKNDELGSLDLTAYNHAYDSANVKTGLTNGLFGGDIVYVPLVKKQYYYNDNGTDSTYNDKLANIAHANGGNGGMFWADFKPSIKLLPIIEAIESKYELSFSRDFFGRTEFTDIYMWLNNSASSAVSKRLQIDFTNTGNILEIAGTEMSVLEDFYIVGNSPSYVRIAITPSAGYESIPYKVIRDLDGQFWTESINLTGNSDTQFRTDVDKKKHTFFVETSLSFKFTAKMYVVVPLGGIIKSATFLEQTINLDFSSANNIPKIKVIDFLAGLFKMFKLVVIAQDDGTIYVNTLKDYYAQGNVWDLTKYIDSSSYEVERGKLLNPINFNFEEPQTLLNIQFDKNTGQYYGDEELILEDEDGEQLDGESYDVKLPFEQVIYERLININTGGLSSFMYGGIFDESIEPVNPKLHLHYVQNTPLNGTGLAYVNDVGVKELISNKINVPTHGISLQDPDFSLTWGNEVNEWNGQVIEKTLYSNYYIDFITSVFNIKRRTFKFKAKDIPLRIRLSLQLNDVIKIKEDYYRMDNFITNLKNGEISFNLINSFDNTIAGFSADRNVINTDYQAKRESIYVTNGGNFSFNKIDTGDGINWVTVSNLDSNVYFDFEENTGALPRSMQIEITNTLTFQTITIILNQSISGSFTADTTEITADNTIITADNF
tara:strand:- start:7190 stop:9517 length:2328 start_codon:yes stop_codon:yes gene_type:complete